MVRWSTLCCALLAVATVADAAPVFRLLEAPRRAHWVTHALSHDGSTIAVNAGGHYYLWTAETGYQDLGPGHDLAANVGLAGDGRTVCGTIVDADGRRVAALWRASTGWTPLAPDRPAGPLQGYLGSGYASNRDGTVAVGLAWSATGAAAFRWTAATGAVRLPDSGHGSRATDIAMLVDVVVGFDEHPGTGHRRPARWIGGRLELVGQPDQAGEILAVDGGGDRCCGQLDGHAFLLDDGAGLADLGTLGTGVWDQSLAADVSDAGTVVGWSGRPAWDDLAAFIWTARSGMVPLQEWLRDIGASPPATVVLTDAVRISGDGSAILGSWRDGEGNRGTWLVTGLSTTAYATLPTAEAAPDTSWQSTAGQSPWPPPPGAPGGPIRMR